MKSIADVEAFLSNVEQRDIGLVTSVQAFLAEQKRNAAARGDEGLAKHVWCLETVLAVQLGYVLAFAAIKTRQFYEAWCVLERCEIDLASLERHFTDAWDRFGMPFIYDHVERWQSLFPYKQFLSPEFVELEKV